MKKSLSIAFVYIGLVIGAGFASGREIFQYFNIPSQNSFSSIILATLSFGILSYIIVDISRTNSIDTFNGFIDHITPKLSFFVKLFMTAFMFCGFFVMMSASGTLFEAVIDLPFFWGIMLLAIICFVVFSFDVKGLLVLNGIMVPFMIAGILLISLYSLASYAPVFSVLQTAKENPLISALCYVSYNTITAGAVLVPLAEGTSRKIIFRSALISSAVLGTIIFLVWFALNIYYEKIFYAEMPLLEIAVSYGSTFKTVYAVVLFMSLCTTAVSHGFGILSQIGLEKGFERILASAILCLLAIPFAYLGFSNLIANLYSIFGAIGLLWTGLVIAKYLKRR